MFVGYLDNNRIQFPDQKFIDNVYDEFEIDSLGSGCMIQLNLNNKIEIFDYSTESHLGQLGIETIYLDDDGKFYDESSESTKKIFMFGDKVGSINTKIKYYNGNTDYLETYCSKENYLVEQL